MLVYDITNAKSFESLESWREEFLLQGQPKDPDNFPFVVIGNKCDRAEDKKVSILFKVEFQYVQQWCKKHGNIQGFEASAKESTNVENAFLAIAKSASS